MKIFMTHDLSCALGELAGAACLYPNGHDTGVPTERSPALDLVLAAVAFTVQLAIESGRDPAEMRTLERALIDALGSPLEAPRGGGE